MTKPNLPSLLDPLGLPVSPEVMWEQIADTVRTVGEGITESVLGLDMNGSFKDFNTGRSKTPDVAKSRELLKEEEELNRKRVFFQSLQEDLKRAQGVAYTPEIDDLTVAAATMSTEDRNEKLGHQKDYARKNTENRYSIAYARAKLIEERRQAEAKNKQVNTTDIAPQGKFVMGENELLKGGENQNHWTKGVG